MSKKIARWEIRESHKFLIKNPVISVLLAVICAVAAATSFFNWLGTDDYSLWQIRDQYGSVFFSLLATFFLIYGLATMLVRNRK